MSEEAKGRGVDARQGHDAPGSPARDPGAPPAVTLANLLKDPPIHGVELAAAMSSLEHADQLSEIRARQEAAPLKEGPTSFQGDSGRSKFAEYFSAVLDFALFPVAVKPEDSSTMRISSESDSIQWTESRLPKFSRLLDWVSWAVRVGWPIDCVAFNAGLLAPDALSESSWAYDRAGRPEGCAASAEAGSVSGSVQTP